MNNNYNEIAKIILGRNLTDLEIQQIFRLNQLSEVDNNDAFAIFTLMNHLQRIYLAENYGNLPDRIEKLMASSATSAANRSTANVNNAVAGLIPAVEGAVSHAAEKAAKKSIKGIHWGSSVFALGGATLVVGLAFALGAIFSSPLYAGWLTNRVSSEFIWNRLQWGIGMGLASPTLTIIGAHILDDDKQILSYCITAVGILIAFAIVFLAFKGI